MSEMSERISDEKLELFAGMPTIDQVDTTVKRMASDAIVSREFQSDVMSPLFDQMEQAGYTGTWSEKVRQACELKAFHEMPRLTVTTGHGISE